MNIQINKYILGEWTTYKCGNEHNYYRRIIISSRDHDPYQMRDGFGLVIRNFNKPTIWVIDSLGRNFLFLQNLYNQINGYREFTSSEIEDTKKNIDQFLLKFDKLKMFI